MAAQRSKFSRIGLVLLGLLVVGCGDDLPAPEPHQPGDLRVVLILIDTVRADRLPPAEYDLPIVPFLESLAPQSIVFRHAHSTSSWTAPAVASLFTSQLPVQHGVETGLFISRQLGIEVNRLPDDLTLLPEMFQDAGYATLGVSDNVNVGRHLGFDRGFDRFHETNDQGAGEVSAVALDWLEEIQERGRTFLYLHFLDPHRPYHQNDPWYSEFHAQEEERVACYDSELRSVDAHIAELFERFHWDENTLLIVMSDHGEEFGDHGGDNHGHTLYSELIDIPLMLYCPRLWPTGRIEERHVSIMDVLPTLAELCDLTLPSGSMGTSLLRIPEGSSASHRLIYSHLRRRDLGEPPEGLVLRSAIVGDRKLILSNEGERQLFDLARDPHEQIDHADDWPALAGALEPLVLEFESHLTSHAAGVTHIELSDELREQLESLGYLEGADSKN